MTPHDHLLIRLNSQSLPVLQPKAKSSSTRERSGGVCAVGGPQSSRIRIGAAVAAGAAAAAHGDGHHNPLNHPPTHSRIRIRIRIRTRTHILTLSSSHWHLRQAISLPLATCQLLLHNCYLGTLTCTMLLTPPPCLSPSHCLLLLYAPHIVP